MAIWSNYQTYKGWWHNMKCAPIDMIFFGNHFTAEGDQKGTWSPGWRKNILVVWCFWYWMNSFSWPYVFHLISLYLFDNILQTERAYQKQAPIFQNKKRVLGQPGKKKELRYVRNVGLGFKTPKDVSSVYLWVHGSHYSSDLLPINRKSYCRGRFFFSGFLLFSQGLQNA